MIGGQAGPPPNLLKQWELGTVPKELAHEHGSEDGERTEGKQKLGARRRWFRFWRKGKHPR